MWREATPDDHVCVAPVVRDRVSKDTWFASNHWEATADGPNDNSTVGFPFVLYPDRDNVWINIQSMAGSRDSLVVDADTGPVIRGLPRSGPQPVRVQAQRGRDSQYFVVLRRGDGNAFQNQFQLMDRPSGQCLTVVRNQDVNGSVVSKAPCKWAANQVWSFEGRKGTAAYNLRLLSSGKCLDAHTPPPMTEPAAGTWLQQWDCNGRKNQAWAV